MKNSLAYYLDKAKKGDGEAAFRAARILQDTHASQVLVQNQLRKAASEGYIPAYQWLGLLGILGELLNPISSVNHLCFYNDFSEGLRWLRQGVEKGDSVCTFILAKCYQTGIGVEINSQYAEDMLKSFDYDKLSLDIAVDLLFLFTNLKTHQVDNHKANESLQILLAS